jgi:hypothetical protein
MGLSLPSIARKTEKMLPRYRDGEQSDVFVMSGFEDLVPALVAPTWKPDVVERDGFRVERFRPRIEGAFARIERWTDQATGIAHWRTITGDNVTTLYGRSSAARIADPTDDRRIFQWLIEETRDDKGNDARIPLDNNARSAAFVVPSSVAEITSARSRDAAPRSRPLCTRWSRPRSFTKSIPPRTCTRRSSLQIAASCCCRGQCRGQNRRGKRDEHRDAPRTPRSCGLGEAA